MGFIKQTIRGMKTLPYVGAHPGTPVLALFTIMVAMAGSQRGGLYGAAVSGLCSLIFFGIPYLCGAYSRAELSDYLHRKQEQSHDE